MMLYKVDQSNVLMLFRQL